MKNGLVIFSVMFVLGVAGLLMSMFQKSEQQSERSEETVFAQEGTDANTTFKANTAFKQDDEIGEEAARWLEKKHGHYVSHGRIEQGEAIGLTGSTGTSTGAHLHLGLWNPDAGDYVNPVQNRATKQLKYGFEWPYINDDWSVSRWFDCTGFWSSIQRSECPLKNSDWGTGRFFHNGVDVAAPTGAYVRAIGSGDIIYRGVWGGAGYTVMIEHDNGLISRYFHLLPF